MKIEILYPEICNLYGDLANPKYLARSCAAELVCTSLSERPKFTTEDIALVCMCGTTERGQSIARDALAPYAQELENRTAAGGVTLFTGNALEILGSYLETGDGDREEMLGLFPIHARRNMEQRYNSLYLGKLDDMDIVGFKSQFSHSYGEAGGGLFTTVRGAGLNPDVVPEGVRRNNLMATYVIGPVAVLNPPFAKYLLRLMGVAEPELAFEEAAVDAYNHRVRQFQEPGRGFVY